MRAGMSWSQSALRDSTSPNRPQRQLGLARRSMGGVGIALAGRTVAARWPDHAGARLVPQLLARWPRPPVRLV